MLDLKVTISNMLGLHARAAAQLVRLADTFASRVTIQRIDNGVEANAKSILSVLHLAAGLGVEIRLVASGIDEREAIERIGSLFADKFGEDQ